MVVGATMLSPAPTFASETFVKSGSKTSRGRTIRTRVMEPIAPEPEVEPEVEPVELDEPEVVPLQVSRVEVVGGEPMTKVIAPANMLVVLVS